MKLRLENKTENQKDLDRKLFEEIGSRRPVNGIKSKPVLKKIKMLIKSGATIDHCVARGMWNAIHMAMSNNKRESEEVAKYLFLENLNFQNKSGFGYLSSLEAAILENNKEMAKWIIEMKQNQNPIYAFLNCATEQTKEEKINLLEMIEKNYSIAKIIKSDFKQIREHGQFNNKHVRKNLPILFQYCGSKGDDFLSKVFGQSCSLKDSLCWRFKNGQKYSWFVEWMTKEKMETGKWRIKNNTTNIEVKTIIILNF